MEPASLDPLGHGRRARAWEGSSRGTSRSSWNPLHVQVAPTAWTPPSVLKKDNATSSGVIRHARRLWVGTRRRVHFHPRSPVPHPCVTHPSVEIPLSLLLVQAFSTAKLGTKEPTLSSAMDAIL